MLAFTFKTLVWADIPVLYGRVSCEFWVAKILPRLAVELLAGVFEAGVTGAGELCQRWAKKPFGYSCTGTKRASPIRRRTPADGCCVLGFADAGVCTLRFLWKVAVQPAITNAGFRV